ncbi:FadR family transcriptional regulator [Salinicoccus sp. ID82-1]|uniref:FadR family transcriptional regulator n=2 Tax=Staphylococcaceae TaxID=90964 RepID=A0A558B074_9STAP|nr:FadR family transcriptional regulator [Salinicoccus sp. ID82-1]TVT29886.1 FadR family transcriptional regulator [Salinicoccus cyprini]
MTERKGLENIVEEIHNLIESENIQVGDKLPSERYLKEKLNVSRQSVREALRALELLGIIYVRRGEGTFLADVDSHQLFQLIGKYLIRTERQQKEIIEIKQMIEAYVKSKHDDDSMDVEADDNQIMKKIYVLLDKYSQAFKS